MMEAFTRRILVTLAGAVVMGIVAAGPALAVPGQTGHGVMVNLRTSGDLGFDSFKLHVYDRATAAGFFTNAWDGNPPAVECAGLFCPTATPPAAPAPPDPSGPQLSSLLPFSAVSTNKCTFFAGGTLTGKSYTQDVAVKVGTGLLMRTYTFTYTYVILPGSTDPVAPLTAWTFVTEVNAAGTVPVTIDADIAAESVLDSSNPKVGRKYTFDLDVEDGASPVRDLVLSLDDAPVATPGASVVRNCPGCRAGDPGALDFTYATNAGSNGNTALLADGDARTILATDGFAHNDDGGEDGSDLALAMMDPVTLELGAGDHTVTLTGIVKDHSAFASHALSVIKTVHVVDLFLGCPSFVEQ